MIYYKNAADTLDYELDWGEWLAGDTIATATWTVATGLTKVKDEFDSTTTTVWLSGGTAGSIYIVSVLITTSGGRVSSRFNEIRMLPTPGASHAILSPSEAADVLRCEVTDVNMLELLPLVDDYIEMATGRNWAGDDPVVDKAKSAARMLLVKWHENPAMVGSLDALDHGLKAVLTQLEVLAMDMEG